MIVALLFAQQAGRAKNLDAGLVQPTGACRFALLVQPQGQAVLPRQISAGGWLAALRLHKGSEGSQAKIPGCGRHVSALPR